ncbi:MAG: UDP-2,3-diacylglucosamine diphosphatase LpxI [Candidatus Kaelpia aquatica]|nr:UDP-2,3-diacylglucosamine diphosphatase LpxI [Candidatus Kaelpia aquatica]
MQIERIGLIAGGTGYPLLAAKQAKLKGVQVYAVAIKGLTLSELEREVEELIWIELGQFQPLVDFFKKHEISSAIMAGNVKKEDLLKHLKLGPRVFAMMKGFANKSDMNLLDILAGELKKVGIDLLDARTFLDDYVVKKGCLTQKSPTDKEWEDIRFGWDLAKTVSSFDVGLTVIVKDRVALAIEAVEGTNEAIKRGAKLGGEGFVVVKVARPNQDMRFELPVVGLDTIKLLKELKASILAVEADKTLFFDVSDSIKEADENSISIVAL